MKLTFFTHSLIAQHIQAQAGGLTPSLTNRGLNGLIGAIIALSLSACTRYEFYVNEQAVYKPPKLYSDYRISDEALRECVKHTIFENKITAAEALKQLNCSSAGIQTLAGLEVFTDIEALNVADNQLSQVNEITRLKKLKQLRLTGNAGLDCSVRENLAPTLAVAMPDHCEQ